MSNRYFAILVFVLPIFLYFIPVDWLNKQHTICLFKNIFGIDCYGCGITRATLSALQFDFVNAYHYNKMIVVVFPLLIYVWFKQIRVLFPKSFLESKQ